MTEVKVLLAIATAIFFFLGVSGSFRRCCGNSAFAMVAFAAYTLMPAVIAYLLGLIQNAPFCSPEFPVWATCLVVALGNMDSYTAHSMEDIERWKSFKIDSAAKFILISWVIFKYAFLFGPIMWILLVALFIKVGERAQALMLASNSVMQKDSKFIADYMSTEHQWSDSSDEDPATMRGYRYLVIVADEAKVHSLCSTAKWRRKAALWLDGDAPHYQQSLKVTDEVITVEKVWNCEGRLLSVRGRDRDGRLKDLCLSFSLFKFICLRFTGYSLPREAHSKLRRMIQYMLSKENGYERVFRIIEVELAFVFDLFCTKYPVNLRRRHSVYRLLPLSIVVASPLLLLCLAISLRMVLVSVLIVLLIMSILAVELAQFATMIFSEWAKVTYICKYVRNEWWQRNRCAGKLIEILCRVWLVKPWGRQLRQYSLLKLYSYSPSKNGQKQLDPTNLSKEVKMAISRSLGKYLVMEHASLRRNDLSDELSWACNLETTTHIIMVWHIATTFCEHERQLWLATKLPQYLAYLVVFAPRLLPGHPCRTDYIFDRAVGEARELLELVNGAADKWQIWKVLADFWADMMLYVAPSNDTAAHAKYLTTGGEFVTHVWVLVSHAGITRDPPSGKQYDDLERS
ncbi:hypothetical protein BT93_L4284 [Corymbia citriodora subsp. variegata]|uniref:DUF4220 domain-containing protein n=1 Tax=Corymbia citriodora subsp. variegata TaxID=360336 RepID=A0A8T0CYE7_CORYI|nr:hypothetical protein BT93_L4284 [Corymbia citriodora subsp. variegata]